MPKAPMMKAIGLTHYLPIDDPKSLMDTEVDKPIPKNRDLRVAIKAIAINPVDVKVRAPKDKVEDTPRILGWDASGVVEAVGEDVTLFKVGDEVFYAGDITRPGAYAEFQCVDERIVGFKPISLSFAEAAALPLTTLTAYESFFDRLGLDREGGNKGETLLIIGGAGGVGSIGIQLAKHAGLTVIATASREETTSWVKKLGADHVINHREALRPQVEKLGLNYIDHIAIFNNTDGHWNAVTDLIRPEGRIVSIVENSKPLEMEQLKSKAAGLIWEFMFARAMYETPDMIKQHELLNYVSGEIDAGHIQTTLNEILRPINAQNLREAHKLVETGRAKGKIVLESFGG